VTICVLRENIVCEKTREVTFGALGSRVSEKGGRNENWNQADLSSGGREFLGFLR